MELSRHDHRRMYRIVYNILLIFGVLSVVSLVPEVHGATSIVRTSKGYVLGLTKGHTIRFQGIPYATAERFQYPNTDVTPWPGVMNTSSPGPMCYQHCDSNLRDLYCMPEMSEDCLTLNVVRPTYTPSSGDPFPVIVYIHGGEFTSGSGGASVYDGDYFSSRGQVVIVTLNYRLGAFGFLSIFDKYGDAAGNFGFRDQLAALTWVKDNIAAFHGDPNKITLVGDGAGCLSIVAHLASPTSQPLFNSAILQSCPLNIPFRTRQQARTQAERFSQKLGCEVNDVSCYRSKRAHDVLLAQMAVKADSYSQNMLMEFYPWGPSIDDHEIYYHPKDIFKDLSRFENKPIIIGTVADEGVSYVYKRFPHSLSSEEYSKFIYSATGQRPASVPGVNDMRESLVTFINNQVFACPALFAAKQIEEKQRQSRSGPRTADEPATKIWLYEFHTPTRLPISLTSQQQQLTSALWPSLSSPDDGCDKRSCHGSDVRTMFNSESLPLVERLKVETLAKQMVRYWSNFARADSVNGIIASRAHLRTLQMHSALRADSQSFFTMSRPRSQRINLPSVGLDNSQQISTPVQIALHSALATFTYWPNYTAKDLAGGEIDSTMLLQTPPLLVRRFHWQDRCQNFIM